MSQVQWLSSYLSAGLVWLGGYSVDTGDGSQSGITICDDLRGFDSLMIAYRWVNGNAGTVSRLHLEFNNNTITGSGYHRTYNGNSGATTGTGTGNIGLLEENNDGITIGTAFLDVAIADGANTLRTLRSTAISSTGPSHAGNDLFSRTMMSAWVTSEELTSIQIRSTNASNVSGSYIAEKSRFNVYGFKTDQIAF